MWCIKWFGSLFEDTHMMMKVIVYVECWCWISDVLMPLKSLDIIGNDHFHKADDTALNLLDSNSYWMLLLVVIVFITELKCSSMRLHADISCINVMHAFRNCSRLNLLFLFSSSLLNVISIKRQFEFVDTWFSTSKWMKFHSSVGVYDRMMLRSIHKNMRFFSNFKRISNSFEHYSLFLSKASEWCCWNWNEHHFDWIFKFKLLISSLHRHHMITVSCLIPMVQLSPLYQ